VRGSCLIDVEAVSGGGGYLAIGKSALEAAARARGTTARALARTVLHAALREGLLDAVLDDGKHR
jgi:hypothetical protein